MILDYEVFIKTLALTLAIALLIFTIINLWMKYHHKYIFGFIIGASFYVLALLFYLFYTVTFGLEKYRFYLRWSKSSLIIASAIILLMIIIFKITQKHKLSFLFKTSDYKSVFYKTNVLSFITDKEHKVLLVNQEESFKAIFDQDQEKLDSKWIERIKDSSKKKEICWIYNACFYVLVTPLSHKKHVIGYLITLDDVTGLEAQKQALKIQNINLMKMNHALKETTEVQSQLILEENRLDVLREIQEKLISEIQNVIESIDDVDINDVELYHSKSKEVAEKLRQSYKHIRETIRHMKGDLNE